MSIKHVQEIAKVLDGTIEEVGGPLPDGSGFAVISSALPKTHWLYEQPGDQPYCDEPPMLFRMGTEENFIFSIGGNKISVYLSLTRRELADKIIEAGKYAVRATTDRGKEEDWDPDAWLQNLVVGLLGYWTEDGLSHV